MSKTKGLKDLPKQVALNNILMELHGIGGCDADDEWSKGYDRAIDNAIAVVHKYSELTIEQLLEEEG